MSRFSHARTSWKSDLRPSILLNSLASHTHARVESFAEYAQQDVTLTRFSHARTSWKGQSVSHWYSTSYTFLSANLLLLYFIFKYSNIGSRLTHTVFDSHLNRSSVRAYEIPLLGSPITGFPSFVCCCFVVTGELYHFQTESQDFFWKFLSHTLSAYPKLFTQNKKPAIHSDDGLFFFTLLQYRKN